MNGYGERWDERYGAVKSDLTSTLNGKASKSEIACKCENSSTTNSLNKLIYSHLFSDAQDAFLRNSSIAIFTLQYIDYITKKCLESFFCVFFVINSDSKKLKGEKKG